MWKYTIGGVAVGKIVEREVAVSDISRYKSLWASFSSLVVVVKRDRYGVAVGFAFVSRLPWALPYVLYFAVELSWSAVV
jgi:hypothetical protein